jgi:hypothetical protein
MDWLLIMIGASLKTQMDISFLKITFLVFMSGDRRTLNSCRVSQEKNDMRHYEK